MYYKRYEASLSSNTWSDIVDTSLQLLKDLNDNFLVSRELEMAADLLNRKYANYMAIASAALITAKNISYDLAAMEELDTSLCKDAD